MDKIILYTVMRCHVKGAFHNVLAFSFWLNFIYYNFKVINYLKIQRKYKNTPESEKKMIFLLSIHNVGMRLIRIRVAV